MHTWFEDVEYGELTALLVLAMALLLVSLHLQVQRTIRMGYLSSRLTVIGPRIASRSHSRRMIYWSTLKSYK